MPWWPSVLAQVSTADQSLFQYGAIGAIAVILMGAVGYLFRIQVQAMRREQQRADAAEAEIRRLNDFMTSRLIAQLTETATQVSRAAEVLADQRREDRRGQG
jgi:hypothetical protein